jgi:hypothetical protein
MNNSLNSVVDSYRKELYDHGGKEMLKFIDECKDILESSTYIYSTSHSYLWVTKERDKNKMDKRPAIGIGYDSADFIELRLIDKVSNNYISHRFEEIIKADLSSVRKALEELFEKYGN